MMCVWQCSPNSTMIQRRPILCATAPVVPEPANESSTKSPGFVESSSIRLRSNSGLGAENGSLSIECLYFNGSDLILTHV